MSKHRGIPQQHDPPLLFDLEEDVSEVDDIADRHPKIVAEMVAIANSFKANLSVDLTSEIVSTGGRIPLQFSTRDKHRLIRQPKMIARRS